MIISGPNPKLRDWRSLPYPRTPEEAAALTRAEQVMHWAERHLKVPEGKLVRQPIRIAPFQELFLRSVLDYPTRRAVLSIARKNGKTALIAILTLAFLAGPVAMKNSEISSGAMSRDQAALVFNLMVKMIEQSETLSTLISVTPSSKQLVCRATKARYRALAADGSRAVGRSDRVVIGDEWGQVQGPTNPFVDALLSGQGAYDDALTIIISTQARTDADFLSVMIDDAARSGDPSNVVHLYAAPEGCALDDERAWEAANPALNSFRSRVDLADQLRRAGRIAAMEGAARNLLLNQRVSADTLWLSPTVWREASSPPREALFDGHPGVSLGIDLSARHDLTAAVAAARDDEDAVHLLPFVFAPEEGLLARAARDRAPYDAWAAAGDLILVPGATVNYEWVVEWLMRRTMALGFEPATIEFDPWRIDDLRREADKIGFGSSAEWNGVGQTFRAMSPRLEAFEALLLNGRLRHGGHPLLNMAASNARVIQDGPGNIKLQKQKSTQRIDPLVAAVMAVYPVSEGESSRVAFDVGAIIG